MLAVDNLVVILLVGRRHQHGTDEVLFPCRARIDLLADVLQQLMHFLVRPYILALIVRDDVEVFPEYFYYAVFVVLDTGRVLCPCLFVLSRATASGGLVHNLNVSNQLRRITAIPIRCALVLQLPLQCWLNHLRE